MANCGLPLGNKQKQDRAHEQSRDENADGDEHAELGKTHRAAQHQREKSHCGGERPKENGASKFCYRGRDCLLMRFPICAPLVVAPNRENCEINAEADENRAKGNTDHAESPEKKLPGCKRHQTREEKAKPHADQRQPSAKTSKKDDAYQHD